MGKIPKHSFFSSLLCVMLLIAFFSACNPVKLEHGRFRFAFVAIDEQGNVVPLVRNEISRDMFKLKLKMFFQPVKNSFLYVLLFDSEYNIRLIFPDCCIHEFYNYVNNYKEYYIPGEKKIQDMITDDRKYTMHVIISVKRLTRLEEALTDYDETVQLPDGRAVKLARQKISLKVVRILQQILSDVDTAPEKEIPIMGTQRSAECQIIRNYCEEFSFKDYIYEIYSLEK